MNKPEYVPEFATIGTIAEVIDGKELVKPLDVVFVNSAAEFEQLLAWANKKYAK